MPPDLARKFKLLRLSLTAPAPRDPALRKEMTGIAASLEADYGKGKYCRKPGRLPGHHGHRTNHGKQPRSQGIAGRVGRLAQGRRRRCASATPDSCNCPTRRAGNWLQGYRSAMWRSDYDMPPDEFSAEIERLWQQVSRFIFRCTPMSARGCREKYGPEWVHPTALCPPICWAIPGRRNGATFIHCWRIAAEEAAATM